MFVRPPIFQRRAHATCAVCCVPSRLLLGPSSASPFPFGFCLFSSSYFVSVLPVVCWWRDLTRMFVPVAGVCPWSRGWESCHPRPLSLLPFEPSFPPPRGRRGEEERRGKGGGTPWGPSQKHFTACCTPRAIFRSSTRRGVWHPTLSVIRSAADEGVRPSVGLFFAFCFARRRRHFNTRPP